jgi:hypothetical protein
MKKFVDGRNITLLCPFCNCRVLPQPGFMPINPCRMPLLGMSSIALPVPIVRGPLRFKFIPLTAANLEFWETYASAMRMIANNLVIEGDPKKAMDMKGGWTQAVRGFLEALKAFQKPSPKRCEVWIAVAALGEISEQNFAQAAWDIEMCMTVTTHRDVSFTTHMGILRSPLRQVEEASRRELRRVQKNYRIGRILELLDEDLAGRRPVRDLSGRLHAFAARQCLRACSQHPVKKRYMVTAPLKKMKEIMEKSFRMQAIEFNAESGILKIGLEAFDLGGDWKNYDWLATVLYLQSPTPPKIAIKLEDLTKGSKGEDASNPQ